MFIFFHNYVSEKRWDLSPQFFVNYFLAGRVTGLILDLPRSEYHPPWLPQLLALQPAILLAFVKNFISNIFYLTCSGLLLGRSKVWTYKGQNYFGPPRSRYQTLGLSQFWALSSSHFASVYNELQAILHGFPWIDTYYWFILDIVCLFWAYPVQNIIRMACLSSGPFSLPFC